MSGNAGAGNMYYRYKIQAKLIALPRKNTNDMVTFDLFNIEVFQADTQRIG
jgi:hypothetical protein